MHAETKIKRETVDTVLRTLVPALGIGDVAVTDKKMIVRIDDRMYVVNDGGRMGAKALAEAVRDLVLYGHSDRVTYTKEVSRR